MKEIRFMFSTEASARNAWSGLAVVALGTGAAIALKRRKKMAVANKVVVITGGSRGLGLALAEEFGRHGARLVLAARKQEELSEAKHRLLSSRAVRSEDRVLLVPCDLTEHGSGQRLVSETLAKYSRLDVLINNAGVIHVGPIEKQPLEMYFDAMNSNFYGMLRTTYAALPHMLRNKAGSIVNIASIGGKIPVPHLAPYTASKFAAVGFSETLHAELRSKGIRVTTVNPGLLRSGSYPNAIVTGQKEKEYEWFALSASIPGVAHSVEFAARKIFKATVAGRAEIEVGLDAYLAARVHGLVPSATQALGSLADQIILPATGGDQTPVEAKELPAPGGGLWKQWSDKLTSQSNEPSA